MNGRLVPQRRESDCGISALAYWRRMRYEDVFVAAVKACPDWKRSGTNMRDLQTIARKLGFPMLRKPHNAIDLDEDAGILSVVWNKPKKHLGWTGHLVVLRKGIIVDPAEPSVSDADDYLLVNDCRVGSLLVEAE
jgi:ABC-type bacteriocin/lantibiotic exporter with double-glycine peptidase domain